MPFKSAKQRCGRLKGMPANQTSFKPGHTRSSESIEKQRQTMKRKIAAGEQSVPVRSGPLGRKQVFCKPLDCIICGEEKPRQSSNQKICSDCIVDESQRQMLAGFYICYGLKPKTYFEWSEACEGRCMICGSVPDPDNPKFNRLCIDHNHETGAVRGLLCMRCNTLLHQVEYGWYVKAMDYLIERDPDVSLPQR